MFFMIFIVIFVSFILLRAVHLFNSERVDILTPISRTRHYLSLEIIWTILPLVILFWIALPSFALLYSIDHCSKVELTIKVIGRQWYWSYEIDTYVPSTKVLKLKETGVKGFLSGEKTGDKVGGFLNLMSRGIEDFERVNNYVYAVTQTQALDSLNAEGFGELIKTQRRGTIEALATADKSVRSMLDDGVDIYDISLISAPECDDVMCVKGLAMLKTEAVKRLALILGSEVVNPEITPSEFDAILGTIPEETLSSAIKKLRVSLRLNPEPMKSVERLGGSYKWLRSFVLNTSTINVEEFKTFKEIVVPVMKKTAEDSLLADLKFYGDVRPASVKKLYLDDVISNCKQNIVASKKHKNTTFGPKHLSLEFDSCILSDNETYKTIWRYAYWRRDTLDLEELPTSFCGWWRLLEVDNRLILPIKTKIRILVTSSDVIHSWAVPSLGVKIDACPGRLNCVYVYIKRPGVFHGQCSELCGIKHGFMPIVVHAVTKDKYNRWFADNCEIVK